MHQESDERYQGGYQNSSAPLGEEVPLASISSSAANGNGNDGGNMNNSNHSYSMNQSVGSSIASVEEDDLNEADLLARKLMACNDNDDLEKIVLRRSLNIPYQSIGTGDGHGPGRGPFGFRMGMGRSAGKSIGAGRNGPLFVSKRTKGADRSLVQNLIAMISLAMLGLAFIFVLLTISTIVAGPPNEPVGPYKLVELQVCVNVTKRHVRAHCLSSSICVIFPILKSMNLYRREKTFSITTYSTMEWIRKARKVTSIT